MIGWLTKELFWCTVFIVILFFCGYLKTQDQFYRMIIGWFIASIIIAAIKHKPKVEEE